MAGHERHRVGHDVLAREVGLAVLVEFDGLAAVLADGHGLKTVTNVGLDEKARVHVVGHVVRRDNNCRVGLRGHGAVGVAELALVVVGRIIAIVAAAGPEDAVVAGVFAHGNVHLALESALAPDARVEPLAAVRPDPLHEVERLVEHGAGDKRRSGEGI